MKQKEQRSQSDAKSTNAKGKGKKVAESFTFPSSNRSITGTTIGRVVLKRGTSFEGD